MGLTKIEWCERSWNPITGCSKISPGCAHCYASRMAKRLAGRCGYPADEPFRVTLHPDKLDEPLHWRKPARVFVCSMGDLFHEDVPFETIRAVIARMLPMACNNWASHTFMILTKRPQRMKEFFEWLQSANDFTIQWPLPNVFCGVTVEHSDYLWRLDPLRQIPAAVRFISYEPALADLGKVDLTGISWIICGGESGPKARPMDADWARSLRGQCIAAGVPFFMKQMAKKTPIPNDLMVREWPA